MKITAWIIQSDRRYYNRDTGWTYDRDDVSLYYSKYKAMRDCEMLLRQAGFIKFPMDIIEIQTKFDPQFTL